MSYVRLRMWLLVPPDQQPADERFVRACALLEHLDSVWADAFLSSEHPFELDSNRVYFTCRVNDFGHFVKELHTSIAWANESCWPASARGSEQAAAQTPAQAGATARGATGVL